MKLKKKYFLIAFCAVTLLVFVSTSLGRMSQKATEKDMERMVDMDAFVLRALLIY